jgi:arginase
MSNILDYRATFAADMHTVNLIGAAWGLGATEAGCESGPETLQSREMERQIKKYGMVPAWQALIRAPSPHGDALRTVSSLCHQLADATEQLAVSGQPFGIIGGDHSCAIGTWNGARRALNGSLGLLWIDAHMDAHTLASSRSGALHGMPLACLLGYGDPGLTALDTRLPVLRPQDVCLIGVRSYEPEEGNLLDALGVRVFPMAEINTQGLDAVIAEALAKVTRDTVAYGISIDLDAIDPADAPGVGTPEDGGIPGGEMVGALVRMPRAMPPMALEIAELNPRKDPDQSTATLVCRLLGAVLGERDKVS